MLTKKLLICNFVFTMGLSTQASENNSINTNCIRNSVSSTKISKLVEIFEPNKIKNVTMVLEGYPAIVFQHEYDHLDGIMYVDKMYKVKDLDKNILPLYTTEDDEDETEENKK